MSNSDDQVTRIGVPVPKVTSRSTPQAKSLSADELALERLRGERDPEFYELTLHGPSLRSAGRKAARSLGLEIDCDGVGCWYVIDLFEHLASCWNCDSLVAKDVCEYSYVERDRGVMVEVSFCGRCSR